MLSPNEENARFRLEQFGESVYCEAMREKLPHWILGVMVYCITVANVDGRFTIGSFWTFGPNPRVSPDRRKLIEVFKANCNIQEPRPLNPSEIAFANQLKRDFARGQNSAST